MIYDAAAVARRGLGADEVRLASPAFMDAVRWAAFAERVWLGTDELQSMTTQAPDGLTGQARTDFMAARNAARAEIKNRRVALLLDEPEAVSDG